MFKLNLFTLFVTILVFNKLINANQSPDKLDEELHENQIPPPSQQPEPEVVKDALKENFKSMDKDMDKLVTAEEVKLWMQSVHDKLIDQNVKQQWDYYEPEKSEVHSWKGYEPEVKEVLTWEKYLNRSYPPEIFDENLDITKYTEEEIENINGFKMMVKRAERRWKVADANNDTILVFEEFRDFVHPEESQDENVKEVLVIESFEDMDKDNNSEVSYDEYITHIKSLANKEDKEHPDWLQVQQTHYKTYLDKNKDGVLNIKEMKEWILPAHDRHDSEGERLISLADVNKDNKLSIDEILDKFEHFLPLLPPDFWSKYGPQEETTEQPTNDKQHDDFNFLSFFIYNIKQKS